MVCYEGLMKEAGFTAILFHLFKDKLQLCYSNAVIKTDPKRLLFFMFLFSLN